MRPIVAPKVTERTVDHGCLAPALLLL